MPKVKFLPFGMVIELRPGETILGAGRRAGLPFANGCSGHGLCGRCRVRVKRGLPSLDAPNPQERKVMASYHYGPGERAACQVIPHGDITVTLAHSTR